MPGDHGRILAVSLGKAAVDRLHLLAVDRRGIAMVMSVTEDVADAA